MMMMAPVMAVLFNLMTKLFASRPSQPDGFLTEIPREVKHTRLPHQPCTQTVLKSGFKTGRKTLEILARNICTGKEAFEKMIKSFARWVRQAQVRKKDLLFFHYFFIASRRQSCWKPGLTHILKNALFFSNVKWNMRYDNNPDRTAGNGWKQSPSPSDFWVPFSDSDFFPMKAIWWKNKTNEGNFCFPSRISDLVRRFSERYQSWIFTNFARAENSFVESIICWSLERNRDNLALRKFSARSIIYYKNLLSNSI